MGWRIQSSQIVAKMFLKYLILVAAFAAVAYTAAIEPLEPAANEESHQDVAQAEPHVREKRLIKKALLLGGAAAGAVGLGAAGLGLGLAKDAYLTRHKRYYPASGYGYGSYGYSYPSYGYSSYGYPSYGYSYPSYGYGYPDYGSSAWYY